MALRSPINLSDEDKLEVLQRLDQFRLWHSLDEKRYCLVCGKIITGRQIQVENDIRGDGPQRLNCPTERCNSIPMDWALPTDEVLAAADTVTTDECNVSPAKAVDSGVEPSANFALG